MPKQTFLIVLISLLITTGSCTQKKKITGSQFIPRNTFVLVLTDMYLMDGITSDMKYYRKFDQNDTVDIYSGIFEKYNITKDDYFITLEEYSKYPQLLDDVYDDVLAKLNIMLEQVENDESEKPVKDKKDNSIKKTGGIPARSESPS